MVELVEELFKIKCICGKHASKHIICFPAILECTDCKLTIIIAKSKEDLRNYFSISENDFKKQYGSGTHGKLEIKCSCGKTNSAELNFQKNQFIYFECKSRNCKVFLITERSSYITEKLYLSKGGNYRAKTNKEFVDYTEF